MARNGKDGSEKASKGKVEWKGFVNVYLNSADKAAIRANPISGEGVFRMVERLTEEGYKLSVTYSASGGFYTVTCYGSDPSKINAGYAMSLRHGDLSIALSSINHVMDEDSVGVSWADRFTKVDDHNW